MAVPAVAFHTGVAEPLPFACRLLRKAWRQGARVIVTAPPATLAALDTALWTFEAQEFLPHLRLPGAVAVAARSPVWLAEAALADDLPPALLPHAPRIRVNLGAEAPAAAAAVDRLIEIVGTADDERAGGRARWRHYEQQWGVKPEHHPAAA